MGKGLLGRKLGMTQVFDANGHAVPVTVIKAGPCVVVQKKVADRDGYAALQLGLDEKKESRVNKPGKGHFAKAGVSPKQCLGEIRVENSDEFEVGQTLKADLFSEGETVNVSGVSKGKGFQGVIKRHGFSRGPMSHGSTYHRRTGSLGSTDPARVFKGRKLPGRMGGDRVTVKGLEVVKADPERNLLLLKGSIPGAKGAYVVIRSDTRVRTSK